MIHPEMLELHYPPYWHYDLLQALLVLSRMDLLGDERVSEALDILQAKGVSGRDLARRSTLLAANWEPAIPGSG